MGNPPKHQARKRFGQNFLVDQTIIQKIIQSIHPTNDDHIVEIGPGQGAITEKLLPGCKKLDAIELDRDLIPLLEKKIIDSKFHLHQADALKFDYSALKQAKALRVVGNLPYNISTPLIFHLLEEANNIEDMHFMLQKEVVDRLAATPNNKAYGKLSVITQAQCKVTSLFEIPPQAFDPAPKVQSAFVRLKPRPVPMVDEENWYLFEQIVTASFAHRRKTLRNNLKKNFELNIAEQHIDLTRRAESLSIEEFMQLAEWANQ